MVNRTELLPIPDKLVVLTFDDGNKSDRLFVADVLLGHDFGGTFYITEGLNFLVNKDHYVTWEEVRELDELGFEIGNHTQHHRNVTKLSPEELTASVRHIEKRCTEHGITKPTTFCYPAFNNSPGAARVLEEIGYKFARRGVAPEFPYQAEGARGPAYDPETHHPLLVPTTGFSGPKWNFDDLKWAFAQAFDGRIAVLCFHGVPGLEHPWVTTKQSDFEKYMQYLKEEGCTVIAMRDLAKYVGI
ncbi:MAG: polysaccharide deacetylase family protein [Planctomycetota bacterium]|nr:polysaccharide deacetylase family protein [Planctomycetota bacterium]MDA1140416.1 polysaccharide deacetylase family protein [Planctomycetota bacterium]